MSNKLRKIILTVLGIVIIGTISTIGYILVDDYIAKNTIEDGSAQLSKAYDKSKDNKDNNNKKQYGKDKPVYDADLENMTNAKIKHAADNFGQLAPYVTGTISIPSIALHMPIFDGSSDNKLAVGAGTMKPDQSLTKNGNFALAGHNMNTSRPVLFSRTPQLQAGQKIHLNYKGKKRTYTVTGVKIISPYNVNEISDELAIENEEKWVTLITCTEDSRNRYLIRGVAN